MEKVNKEGIMSIFETLSQNTPPCTQLVNLFNIPFLQGSSPIPQEKLKLSRRHIQV